MTRDEMDYITNLYQGLATPEEKEKYSGDPNFGGSYWDTLPSSSNYIPPSSSSLSSAPQTIQDQINALINPYGTNMDYARQYGPAYSTAYGNLGLPSNIATQLGIPPGFETDSATRQAQGRLNTVMQGGRLLAKSYVDAYYEKYKRLPTEGEVDEFVAESNNSSFASKFIQGTLPDVNKFIVTPYLNDPSNAPSGAGTTPNFIDKLSSSLGDLFGQQRSAFLEQSDRLFGGEKYKLAEDLAAQGGGITSPVSRYSLDALINARGAAERQGLASLAGTQATSGLDLSKTIAGLSSEQSRLAQQASEFRKTLGFSREQADIGNEQYNRYLDIARSVGTAQAEASKKGALDWADTIFKGIGSVASAYGAFKKY